MYVELINKDKNQNQYTSESVPMESDQESRELEPKQSSMEQESEFGIFGDDNTDDDDDVDSGTDKVVSAFTDMVDEIDEDDDDDHDEGVELEDEGGGAELQHQASSSVRPVDEGRNSSDSEDGKK